MTVRSEHLSARSALILLLLGVVSLTWLLDEVWFVTWHRVQLDFSVYVMGAHHLVDGRLYLSSLATSPHLPFTYPPVAALAFWLFALMGRQTGQVTWAACNVISLYAVLVLSLRSVLPGINRVRLLLWAMVLLGPSYLLDPIRLTFYFGQVNLVLCALILIDLTTTPRIGRWVLPRGALVGVAAAIKLVPLVFVPYLFVTRQVRSAWTALAAFVGCSLLAVALDPAVSWSYWTKYVTDAARVGNPSFVLNQSLQGALDRLAHHDVSTVLVDGFGAVILVAGIALARWAWAESSPFLGILVCATTGMVVSPITWEHHLVWAVPVLLWLACATDRPPGGRLWAVAAGVVLWWAPLQHVPAGGTAELHEYGWTLLAGNSFTALLVGFLLGITVLLLVRRHRRRMDRSGFVSGQLSPTPTAEATT